MSGADGAVFGGSAAPAMDGAAPDVGDTGPAVDVEGAAPATRAVGGRPGTEPVVDSAAPAVGGRQLQIHIPAWNAER